MKKPAIILMVLGVGDSSLNVQDLYHIENVWKGTLINYENGSLTTTVSSSSGSVWQRIDAGGEEFRIKNVQSGYFLNIESGALACTPIEPGWHSAKWRMSKANGVNTIRIGNKYVPDRYINNERGLACTPIQPGWLSAQWVMKPVASSRPESTNTVTSDSIAGYHPVFLNKINEFRQAKGLNPVRWNNNLNKAAERHSRDMAGNNQGGHTGSDGSNFSQRIEATGYRGFGRMENVASNNSGLDEDSFTQWYNSPGHNQNMSIPEINSIGYAVVQTASGSYFATLVGGVDSN